MNATMSTTSHQPGCCCSACINLECMERPRFFAGQLLTDADLNSEQAYMLAKNRLHNRYLHGVGVVCGLEVTCGQCDGWVSISPGYAIDPCGNDVVVCSGQDFNLMQAIQDCCTSQKKTQPNCRPYDPAPPKGCTGLEEEWCITIRYQEKEARPTATLPQKKSSCGCGCGGKKKSCGCGCHSSNGNGTTSSGASSSNGCSSSSGTATQNCQNPPLSVCEPTRIVETYQLGVCFHEQQSESLQDVLGGTLLLRILACLQSLGKFVAVRVAQEQRTTLYETAFTGQTSASSAILFEAHTRFHRAVTDLYTQNPFNVRCAGFATLQNIQTPVPGQDEQIGSYLPKVQPWTVSLFGLLVQYAIDCVCHALLPPCPADPCDDRLILACATVKDGKLLRICNFSCRQFAGAFPSFFYWLSAVPIVAILKWLAEKICCGEDLVSMRSPLVDNFAALMNTIDPSGKLRAAIVQEDFALLHRYTSNATGAWQQLAAKVVSFAFNPGDVNLAALQGQPAGDGMASLERAGISATRVEVKSAADVPAFGALISSPFASKGDSVAVYISGGKILSVNRLSGQSAAPSRATGVPPAAPARPVAKAPRAAAAPPAAPPSAPPSPAPAVPVHKDAAKAELDKPKKKGKKR